MNGLVRISLLSSVVVVAAMATGCPAGPGSASAAVPAPAAPAESPEQVVMDVAHGLSQGRPYVAWDAMPASYQDDVTNLVHDYAGTVDAELWNQGFAIVRKVSTMMRNQKDIILAMPKFRESPGFDAEAVGRDWDLVVAPFLTIAESELANAGSLQTIDIRQFLATTGVEFMQDIVRLGEFAENDADNKFAALGQTRATLVSREDDMAMVQIEIPGEGAQTQRFVRVEGKWIPKDMADEWAEEMLKAQAKIAQMSPEKIQLVKPKIMAMLAGIDATVDQLGQAQTPEQFEQTLQMGMFQVFGGMMELARVMEPEPERP